VVLKVRLLSSDHETYDDGVNSSYGQHVKDSSSMVYRPAVARIAAVLVLLLAATCAWSLEEALQLDATEFGQQPGASQAMPGLNHTCFQLCQLSRLPATPPGAASSQTPNSPGHGERGHRSVASISDDSSSTSHPSTAPSTHPAVARHLLQLVTSTSGSTGDVSEGPSDAATSNSAEPAIAKADTACTPAKNDVDPAAAALLRRRLLGFKLGVTLSDFFEIFYSIGNLWSAITDFLKQAVAAQRADFRINVESVLLFNANLAGVTAWWGNLVQNILLLTADAIIPLPIDSME